MLRASSVTEQEREEKLKRERDRFWCTCGVTGVSIIDSTADISVHLMCVCVCWGVTIFILILIRESSLRNRQQIFILQEQHLDLLPPISLKHIQSTVTHKLIPEQHDFLLHSGSGIVHHLLTLILF